MIDFSPFFQALRETPLAPRVEQLQSRVRQKLDDVNHGDLPQWLAALESIPPLQATTLDLDRPALQVGTAEACTTEEHDQLEAALRKLMPWRKGPYSLFGVEIDTEWRSDFKWDRLLPHLSPLEGRTVLDVGCGNGYHCWRMYAAGARRVIGIDPSWKFLIQFQAIKRLVGEVPVELLPLAMEEMPRPMPVFDTVFSMGVLYHRKNPLEHIQELQSQLRPGGELVLETLVVDGGADRVLVPPGRYAQMRNVWFLPSCEALAGWLQRLGLEAVRCVDVNRTSTEEQRSTDWMQFHSLPQFLDPNDPSLTVEGLPAPTRAILIARKPF
ncbi:tRNA 5-methoxyuridine(34)/uridine 5-oxyacetic acid(34) synthase CmoB [Motiliproteus sp. SC1-56]|uniref:tRNA 5-methoxyuridine(34)/uridine 5-oxyacetic acid(34) synthase CmoB n=1 Tax=Motiliproteus sp. SC1-56 TaxID=2799565 RepID=UPI00351C3A01